VAEWRHFSFVLIGFAQHRRQRQGTDNLAKSSLDALLDALMDASTDALLVASPQVLGKLVSALMKIYTLLSLGVFARLLHELACLRTFL
jgi:hypothetical protein